MLPLSGAVWIINETFSVHIHPFCLASGNLGAPDLHCHQTVGLQHDQWSHHMRYLQVGVVQENRHRVMDLRANSMVISPPGLQAMDSLVPEDADPWTLRLMIGSQIASEARAAMKVALSLPIRRCMKQTKRGEGATWMLLYGLAYLTSKVWRVYSESSFKAQKHIDHSSENECAGWSGVQVIGWHFKQPHAGQAEQWAAQAGRSDCAAPPPSPWFCRPSATAGHPWNWLQDGSAPSDVWLDLQCHAHLELPL